jgi:hypothetical protein
MSIFLRPKPPCFVIRVARVTVFYTILFVGLHTQKDSHTVYVAIQGSPMDGQSSKCIFHGNEATW